MRLNLTTQIIATLSLPVVALCAIAAVAILSL